MAEEIISEIGFWLVVLGIVVVIGLMVWKN